MGDSRVCYARFHYLWRIQRSVQKSAGLKPLSGILESVQKSTIYARTSVYVGTKIECDLLNCSVSP